MCGISGFFSPYTIADLQPFQHAALMQKHRGPDNFGQWLSEDGKCALFHNRLSILDLSENGNQPFVTPESTLIYNGEIYNFLDLQQEFFPQAEKAHSDTQVLFDLLNLFGTQKTALLNGMFAFAFLKNNKLSISRDRLGIKPLYYYQQNGFFAFSSEIKTLKALITQAQGKTSINKKVLQDIFLMGHAEMQELPYCEIKELVPGSILHFDLQSGNLAFESYFSLIGAIQKPKYEALAAQSEKSLLNKLDTLLNESVAMHLQSDSPIGALCSGGVDSSLITALAVQHTKQISIYHAGVQGGGGEEQYAELVAKHLNIELRYSYMHAERFLQMLPHAIYHSDLPIYHPNDVSLFDICEVAKNQDVKVLLAGEGADELFGGYSWHQFFMRNSSSVSFLQKLYVFLGRYLRSKGRFLYSGAIDEYVFNNFSPSYLNYFSSSPPLLARQAAILYNSKTWDFYQQLENAYKNTVPESDYPTQTFIANNLQGHLSSILHRNDRMGMMAGIEARVPFLENALIEFGLHLPLKYKINKGQGKYLLKKLAERYIPQKNIYRKKAGFPVPWESYMQQVNKEIFKDGYFCQWQGISYQSLLRWMGNNTQVFYNTLSVELWGRMNVYQQKPDALVALINKK